MKRLLTLLLTLSLAASLAAPAMARETSFFSAFPEEIPQQNRSWNEAAAQADSALTALESALAAGRDATALFSLWQTAAGTLTALDTAYSFLTVDYARDPAAWGGTYTAGTAQSARLNNRYLAVTQQLLSSPCASRLEAELGDTAESFRQTAASTPEQLAMLEEETSLVNDYWQAMAGTYSAPAAGRTWTLEEVSAAYDAGTLSDADYLAVQQEVSRVQNAGAAPILVKLVALRNRYAASLGYDSYADYAYQVVYGRDYDPQEARALQEAVKTYIVPLYQLLGSAQALHPELGMGHLSGLSGLDQETLLDLAEPVIKEVSDEYAALYDYMRAQNLCDIGPLATKAAKGFTVALPEYGSAYLFNAPDGSFYDLDALTHEFGHFADFCLAPDQISCYDTAEICSQGLEVLSLHNAGALAGPRGGAAYRTAVVTQMLHSVISGCLEDEFQQQVYAAGNLTVREMNRLYGSLSAEYGFPPAEEAYGWVQISHTFEMPFYYISYATSALSSLEILARSLDDFDAAADTYLSLVALTDSTGYRDALARTGLSDVFAGDGTVADLAGGILDYLESGILDVPVPADAAGSWAKDSIGICRLLDLFPAGGQQFRPQAVLTAPEAVEVLGRAAGTGIQASDAGLSDPASGTVTRQALVSALCRLLDAQADPAVLRSFPDAAQVSPEAAGAMAWAVETGLVRGTSQGLLAPDRAITRAETAAILSRLFW